MDIQRLGSDISHLNDLLAEIHELIGRASTYENFEFNPLDIDETISSSILLDGDEFEAGDQDIISKNIEAIYSIYNDPIRTKGNLELGSLSYFNEQILKGTGTFAFRDIEVEYVFGDEVVSPRLPSSSTTKGYFDKKFDKNYNIRYLRILNSVISFIIAEYYCFFNRFNRTTNILFLIHSLMIFYPVFRYVPLAKILLDNIDGYNEELKKLDVIDGDLVSENLISQGNDVQVSTMLFYVLALLIKGLKEHIRILEHRYKVVENRRYNVDVVKHKDNINKLLGVMVADKKYSASDLRTALKVKKNTFTRNYLDPALESGKVKMTHPNNPTNSNQKYYVPLQRRGMIVKQNVYCGGLEFSRTR